MKFGKILSCILAVVLSITCIGVNVKAEENKETDIINILYNKGYISDEQIDTAKVVEMSGLNSVQLCEVDEGETGEIFEGVMLNSIQDNENDNPMIDFWVGLNWGL